MKHVHGVGSSALAALAALAFFAARPALASEPASAEETTRPSVTVPRLDRPPTLEDFAGMKPGPAVQGTMAKVEAFVQRSPDDGHQPSERTEAYLGFDGDNVYVVFLAFEAEEGKVRARLVPRERTDGDDTVAVMFDTFDDQRRAYGFVSNPLGVQTDFFQTATSTNRDTTFDTVWESHGAVTKEGYVVLMSIPFKSLRFPPGSSRPWGVVLERSIARSGEDDFWPRVTARIPGVLEQEARLEGISGISAGHNAQFIPYVSMRSSKQLDTRDPAAPHFSNEPAKLDGGVDAKFVLGGRFVLDATVNPDFSQVDSDDPQSTANQRFALFTPEKRPFFLENADFFQTPIQLVFTRRVADPQFGVRLTGKAGPYSVGAMLIDDQAPGETVPETDPRSGERAVFGIVRASRDLPHDSRVGALFTDRELDGGHNRVAAVDARVKFNPNWFVDLQAATSQTLHPDGTTEAGPAYRVYFNGSGRHYFYEGAYNDHAPGFSTEVGFVPRADIRALDHYAEYNFKPEGRVTSWGPRVYFGQIWDHAGQRVSLERDVGLDLQLRGQTHALVWYNTEREGLRPSDYAALPALTAFPHSHWYALFETSLLSQVTVHAEMQFGGTAVNYNPPEGKAPILARRDFDGQFTVTLRPVTRLRVDNTYLLARLRDPATGAGIFDSHLVRSRWNWQFSRELSLRATAQYTKLGANPLLSSLEPGKGWSADLLVAYQVNPWTAFYAGYSGDLQNLDVVERPGGGGSLVRTKTGLLTDSRQFFVKFSYLLRL